MLGGFVGALLVYVFYKDHYKATSDEPDTMLGTFCTMPAIWNPWRNFLSELIATTLLVFIILAIGFEGYKVWNRDMFMNLAAEVPGTVGALSAYTNAE